MAPNAVVGGITSTLLPALLQLRASRGVSQVKVMKASGSSALRRSRSRSHHCNGIAIAANASSGSNLINPQTHRRRHPTSHHLTPAAERARPGGLVKGAHRQSTSSSLAAFRRPGKREPEAMGTSDESKGTKSGSSDESSASRKTGK